MKLLSPDKGGEGEVGKRRERRGGEEKELMEKKGKRTSECSHSSKFATAPLIVGRRSETTRSDAHRDGLMAF